MSGIKIILFSILGISLIALAVVVYLKTNGVYTLNKDLRSESIHGFKVPALDGSELDFADFKGKKILVVNTASKCGFTPQYESLEKLYQTYQDKLVVVGFPSNDFLFQEPGTAQEIQEFCSVNYAIHFPMAAKVKVKGPNQAPIYQWLTKKALNTKQNSAVSWNFQKYLIDQDGRLIGHFDSKIDPLDPLIVQAIER